MEFATILQVLSAVGVIASIIFAGLQVRRNTLTLRASSYFQTAGSFSKGWDDLAQNGELVDLLLRGGDDFTALTRIEKARFRFLIMSYCRRFEVAYFQHQLRILTDTDWQGMSADIDATFSLPGIQVAWPLVKDRINPTFRAHLDGRIKRINSAATALAAGTPR